MKRMTKVILLGAALFVSAQAGASLYLTTGFNYSKVAKTIDRHGAGSSLGLGYRLNDSWNIEFGYDRLIDKKIGLPHVVALTSPVQLDWSNAYQHKGFTVAALGKTAINQTTTLFYRAGISQSDIDYLSYRLGQVACDEQSYLQTNFLAKDSQGNELQRATGCAYRDTSTDLLFGLGLEADFTERWFGRIEAIQYFADKGENISTARLSIGYRF